MPHCHLCYFDMCFNFIFLLLLDMICDVWTEQRVVKCFFINIIYIYSITKGKNKTNAT